MRSVFPTSVWARRLRWDSAGVSAYGRVGVNAGGSIQRRLLIPGLMNIGHVTEVASAGSFPGAACLASGSAAPGGRSKCREGRMKRAKAAPLQSFQRLTPRDADTSLTGLGLINRF
jgi:hypothetical protein